MLAWPKYKTPVNLPELATSKPKPGSFTPIPNPVESPVNVGLPFIVNGVIVSVFMCPNEPVEVAEPLTFPEK